MPARRIASSPMITVSVRCALGTVGSRNAFTPLLTASTPVIAVHPFENTWSNSHMLAVDTVAAAGVGGATTGTGWPPAKTDLVTPMAITINSEPRKAQVGNM